MGPITSGQYFCLNLSFRAIKSTIFHCATRTPPEFHDWKNLSRARLKNSRAKRLKKVYN